MDSAFKALSDPTRRAILRKLRAGPLSVSEIGAGFPVSQSTLSAHLAQLRRADLVETDREGTTIYYRVKLSVLEDALMGFASLFGFGESDGADGSESQKKRRAAQ